MVGLDATMKCVVTDDIIAEIRGIGTLLMLAQTFWALNSTISTILSQAGRLRPCSGGGLGEDTCTSCM